jgi:hypothetical protein
MKATIPGRDEGDSKYVGNGTCGMSRIAIRCGHLLGIEFFSKQHDLLGRHRPPALSRMRSD